MRHRIGINGGAREVRVDGGRSLLASLNAEGTWLPSGCGGQGLCGLCRVQADGEAGPVTEAERRLLSEGDRQRGVRLACQLAVEHDLSIRLPESLSRVRSFSAEVESVRGLTADIRMIEVRLLDPRQIAFEAGAYVQWVLPDGAFRAYSIASPPSSRERLQLIVRMAGPVSSWIFAHAGPGSRCTLVGPFGDLALRSSDRDLLFIANGSGMAPIRSLLLDMADRRIARRAAFLFGARTRAELFLEEEMRSLESRLAGFQFQPVVLDETGRLTEAIGRLPGTLERADAYLAGSPGIVDACLRALAARGLPDGHAFSDRFVG